MKTFTIKFYLKVNSSLDGRCPVYARIIYDRKKCELSTGLKCFPKEWGASTEKFIDSKFYLNDRLIQIQAKIYRVFSTLSDSEKPFSIQDIKSGLSENKKSKILVLDFYEKYIEDKFKDNREGVTTIAKYEQTLRYLKGWLNKSEQKGLRISDFDLSKVHNFDSYLKQTPWNKKGERMMLTSINKHHSRLKAVLFAAFKAGHLSRNPHQDFKLGFLQSKREYLSSEELDRLMSLELNNNPVLNKVRDIFLFSCYTGLRFNDAQNLDDSSLMEINGNTYLRIDQGKTGERIEIPLLDPAKKIIIKYRVSFERTNQGKLLPVLSNQKVNKYLKFLAELAGIKKALTHHVARHTCATTVLLDNEVPLETVSHWLGHRSIRTTQIYAKISHENLSKESVRLNSIL